MTISKTVVLLWLVISIAAGEALAHEQEPAQDRPVAARYETIGVDRAGRITRKSDWYLVRTANRIETAGDGRGEVWERSSRGDVSMRRVFRDDQFILEYHAGDLRAMGIAPEWRALGAVVDPEALSRLGRAGSEEVLGRTAQVYRSGEGQDRVEIWWLEEVALPAVVKRTGEFGTYTMRLVEVAESAPSDWPIASHWKIDEFRIVDAADLGDLEHDPAVKRIMRADASRQVGLARLHAHD
jgi:hypothetical protein